MCGGRCSSGSCRSRGRSGSRRGHDLRLSPRRAPERPVALRLPRHGRARAAAVRGGARATAVEGRARDAPAAACSDGQPRPSRDRARHCHWWRRLRCRRRWRCCCYHDGRCDVIVRRPGRGKVRRGHCHAHRARRRRRRRARRPRSHVHATVNPTLRCHRPCPRYVHGQPGRRHRRRRWRRGSGGGVPFGQRRLRNGWGAVAQGSCCCNKPRRCTHTLPAERRHASTVASIRLSGVAGTCRPPGSSQLLI